MMRTGIPLAEVFQGNLGRIWINGIIPVILVIASHFLQTLLYFKALFAIIKTKQFFFLTKEVGICIHQGTLRDRVLNTFLRCV